MIHDMVTVSCLIVFQASSYIGHTKIFGSRTRLNWLNRELVLAPKRTLNHNERMACLQVFLATGKYHGLHYKVVCR